MTPYTGRQMRNYQQEKQIVREFYTALDTAPPESIAEVLARYTRPDYMWRGYHPFNELHGSQTVSDKFWTPLRRSLSPIQRRMDIFMAGANQIDDFQSVWVVSMGHLMGLFDAPWLGIAPTGKMAFLRYCEFNRIEDGRISETAMFFDIPHLMIQAGLQPFPSQTAAHLVQPGPLGHDGLLYDPQDPAEGKMTLSTINSMIQDLRQWQQDVPLEEELERSWASDMIWWACRHRCNLHN